MVDASLRMNIVNLFRQIVEAKGVSFVYITHDLSTAYYLSDHVSIMKTGRIVEQGKPAAILDHPTRRLHPRADGGHSDHRRALERDGSARPRRSRTGRQMTAATH